MKLSSKVIAVLFTLFLLTGCAPEENEHFNPEADSPTHQEMFKELFGVEYEHNSPAEIFSFSKPPPLLGLGLDIIWFMAAFSLVVIILVGGLKSTLQAPTSKSLLGNDISTPIAPVRIGMAFFLLLVLPGGGHYSVIESIVLSANKYVSNQANKLYTSQVELYKDEYIKVPTGGTPPSGGYDDGGQAVTVAFSKNDYYRLLQTAICIQYTVDEKMTNAAKYQKIESENSYSGNGGGTFTYALGRRYNLVIEDDGWLWFDSPVEGGCGQWYIYTEPPEGIDLANWSPSQDPMFKLPADGINRVIGKELQGAVSQTQTISSMAWWKLQELASLMVTYKKDGTSYNGCGAEDSASMSCEQLFSDMFVDIVKRYNGLVTNGVNKHYRNVLASEYIDDINTDAIDMARNHGWFFAGALPYMFASSAERLNAFENIQLKVSIPQPQSFPNAHKKKLVEYFTYADTVLGMSSSSTNSSMLPKDTIDSEGWVGTYAGCMAVSFEVIDCIGSVAAMKTLTLTRVLASGVSHPLTVTHRIGKSGAASSINALIALRVGQGTASAASAALVGGTPFWGTSLFLAISGIFQSIVDTVSPFLEYLMINYTILGYFVVLMPFVYFSIAIVSYIVTLFVGVIGANFFAVSHAWLEGQGMVSSYAQRGYPSLIFSALTPILIVLVFFVYLYTMPFMFKFLGYAYNLFLTPFMSNGMPDVFGGMFFFTMLIILIIAVHRVWAKLILSIPDRIMRLIGVHEALTQNDFSGEIDQGGQGAGSKIGSTAAGGAAAMGGAMSGNAEQQPSLISGGGGGNASATDATDKSADAGEGGKRDTSGYSGASGGSVRANPASKGIATRAIASVAAKASNRNSEGSGGGQPSGDTSDDNNQNMTDNSKTQDSSVSDSNLRAEAAKGDKDEKMGVNSSKVSSGPEGYGNFNADTANSGPPSGDDSKSATDTDEDLRQQANTDRAKTESTDNDTGVRDDSVDANDEDNMDDNNAANSDTVLREEANDQTDLSESGDKDDN